ncbi:hypothetical protein [Abyssalbus ytuae]|uniref:Uncharacterized protein n=1 Tax=Abyssalbus ytuae TaxID=2926907 RepID=A0A9E7A2U9_9FLAO|nr:hypothetical protein [Abyssalbus ytuae]UOB18816.1 hypothetical protein MQE35_05855 [Abyssalbus ytuae]
MKLKIEALLLFILFSCQQDYGQLKHIAKLPGELNEVSGIQKVNADGLLWAINDHGNSDHIMGVNEKGKIAREINIKGADNADWEELTKDNEGNLYIGDFGNNYNRRKDLAIYKVPNPDSVKGDDVEASKITFNYPEQKDFPPKKSERFYDAEAFFYVNGYFYLFTKNHSKNFDGTTLLYKIPATPGNYEAQLISKYKTCDSPQYCKITAADINKDGTKVVLLGHDRIWLLTNFDNDNFFSGDVKTIPLNHSSQKESICFIDDNTVYIADEKNGSSGRNLYSFSLN